MQHGTCPCQTWLRMSSIAINAHMYKANIVAVSQVARLSRKSLIQSSLTSNH